MWCWWIFSYENCKFRKKLVDKLVEECNENIDEVKMAGMGVFEHGNECMFLDNLCCLNCSDLWNQHWNYSY